MINEDGAKLVTAKHADWCDKVFRSNFGVQEEILGSLVCLCGKPQIYQVPNEQSSGSN